MEGKERYINLSDRQVKDTQNNSQGFMSINSICKTLNQQDKELSKLRASYQQVKKENQRLKQDLHDLPKKIVEDFYDEIRHRAILEDDYCPDHNFERKYGVRKCLLENIRTTILKKDGGEDE